MPTNNKLESIALTCLQGLLANSGLVGYRRMYDINLVERAFSIAELFMQTSKSNSDSENLDDLVRFQPGDRVVWIERGMRRNYGTIHTVDNRGLLIDWDVSDNSNQDSSPPFYIGLESLDNVNPQA